MKTRFGLWRVRTASGVAFTIPMRNEGIVPFEIAEGSLEFITDLDHVTGEQQETILAKVMTDYWKHQEDSEFTTNSEEGTAK